MTIKQTGQKLLRLNKGDLFTIMAAAAIIYWGFWRDANERKKVQYYTITYKLGVYTWPPIITTNSTYEQVIYSNGPTCETYHGVWAVSLFNGQMVTNKITW